jgi:hypothetical protein
MDIRQRSIIQDPSLPYIQSAFGYLFMEDIAISGVLLQPFWPKLKILEADISVHALLCA